VERENLKDRNTKKKGTIVEFVPIFAVPYHSRPRRKVRERKKGVDEPPRLLYCLYKGEKTSIEELTAPKNHVLSLLKIRTRKKKGR